jgi:DNA-binding NarL/FixJ family response regulator
MIVDDHQLVVDGLQLMIASAEDIRCIATASTGEEALAKLQHESVDLVVLDIDMPGMNGLRCCKEIQRLHPAVQVLIISMHQESHMIQQVFEAGALGYLVKSAGKAEVLKAIRCIYRGQKYINDQVKEILLNDFMQIVPVPDRRPVFPKLSRREKEVLQLIVNEYTTSEIANQLFISPGTVETHRRNLLQKLDARNSAGLVRNCLEYRLLD